MIKIIPALRVAVFCSAGLSGYSFALPAANFYIAYYSPADVATQVTYQASKAVNSTIIWDMSGDVNPVSDQKNSLINALFQANPQGYNIAYWADWSIYPTTRALPSQAYFIPGAIDDNGNKITNQDFDDKAKLLNAVVYSFLEIAPDGTIYFNDPWSDLLITDPWCNNGQNKTCSYAYTSQGKPYAAHYGNFPALSNYTTAAVDKYISVGGYAHDASFEQILGDSAKVDTFITTTFALLSQYKLTGIDLDYENPNMTQLQSQQFADLIQTLNKKFAGTQYKIMVTILANPAYLKGELNGNYGFSADVLSGIANLSQVQSINLMTYDFYGAFNYNPNGTGRTGFISDTYLANNAPQGAINFSAQDSIDTLMALGVPAAKISGGIPTYGRALQAINPNDGFTDATTGAYTGLYATIPSTSFIPRGDLDDLNCNQSIYPLTANSCAGSFTYAYIVHSLIDSTFTTVDWKNNSENSFNGTTAYTLQYNPVSKNYNLEVTNSSTVAGGQVLGITNGNVSLGQLDWMGAQADKTYDNTTNPNVLAIQGASDLIVTWNSSYTGKQYQCLSFNFTSNTHIMINPENGACDIKVMP